MAVGAASARRPRGLRRTREGSRAPPGRRRGSGGPGAASRLEAAVVLRVRVRRLKGAALAVVRVVAVGAAVALIMLLVAVLGGLILLAVDTLFN